MESDMRHPNGAVERWDVVKIKSNDIGQVIASETNAPIAWLHCGALWCIVVHCFMQDGIVASASAYAASTITDMPYNSSACVVAVPTPIEPLHTRTPRTFYRQQTRE